MVLPVCLLVLKRMVGHTLANGKGVLMVNMLRPKCLKPLKRALFKSKDKAEYLSESVS